MTEGHKSSLDLPKGPFRGKEGHNQPMELSDGYRFRCKLCGEDHEVPENVPPYRTATHMFFNVHIGAVELGCSTKPGTQRYSFADFAPHNMTTN
jgi:hypothetical protein